MVVDCAMAAHKTLCCVVKILNSFLKIQIKQHFPRWEKPFSQPEGPELNHEKVVL